MLALCSMLSGTYYAHYYASIIGGSLKTGGMYLYTYCSCYFCKMIDLHSKNCVPMLPILTLSLVSIGTTNPKAPCKETTQN